MQHGLLFESTLAGRPWANLEQIVVEGALPQFAAEPMRAAWRALALRHDALRMVLPPDGAGGISQRVLGSPDIWLVEHDLTGPDPDAQVRAVEDFLAKDRQAGIDPMQRPGWRVSLLTLGANRVVMVWTIHHALIDGASMAVVLRDLADLLAGRDIERAPQPGFVQFSTQLPQQDKGAARAFFADMFADGGAPAPLAAPGAPGRMATVSRRMPADETKALRATLRALGGTTLTAVQLAWGLVLARWTGQDEACFGLVDSGRRTMAGFDDTVGCLISTLPLRLRFHPQETLGALVPRLRQTTLAMRAHSHASLTDVRRWAGLPGQTALFDTLVMHSHASLAMRMQALGGIWASRPVRLLEEGTAAATLAVADDPELQILLEHDPGRFATPMAEAVMGHVLQLMSALAKADATTRICDLQMLSPDDHAALLALGQPDTTLPDAPPCLATRFERAVAKSPEVPAVVEAETGRSLSFLALDRAANALALRLQAAGIAAGDIVALHLPRGADHVTALLAVLKLGAAFLPLDPDLPEEWLAGLAARAGVKVVVSHSAAGLGIAVSLPPDRTDQRAAPPPRPPLDPARLAYVLYTSGSTGVPKAVRGLCGALSAHASAVIAAFELGPHERVLQFAGLGFDVALEEIVPTLLAGGTVVIRDAAAAGSVRGLIDLLTRERVTVANLPASFWHVLVDEIADNGVRLPPTLRLVIAGSERIRPAVLRRWRQTVPDVTWINGYGPTETTITATTFVLPPGADLPDPMVEVPIGRPLAHATAVLRAFDGTLVPRGGTGTLWIGGPAVAGGYLGDDSLSREAFQPDPWTLGARLYRTGDLARWRTDGLLEFLGRRDRQIKLRGQRIDLNQIEGLLAGLAGVRQSHVAVMGTQADGTRLVAWVVPEAGASLAEITRKANLSLPQAMVPHLIGMDRLPVGANGKIDVHALPLPRPDPAASDEDGPQDPLTRTIAACMAEVLGVPSVPVTAGFSDLGGDSLLALRLVSLIEKRTGHLLQTANLHHHGSAAALGRLLRSGATTPRYTIPIQPAGRKPPFFAIHVLGRNEDLFRPLAAALGPDQPMFGLSVGIPRNLDDINVERTARIYFDEIQTYHPTGPVGLGAVSMAAYFAYELAQLLHAAGREVRVLAVLDAMGPDGRPALTGAAKLRAHLQQVRQHGLRHFGRVVKNRLDRYRERREALRSAPDQVNAHNLIAANVCAVEFYRPKPYDGPLTVFRADHSFWDSPEALASGLGWASVARGGLRMHDLPGTHLSILQPGNVEVLAAHLKRLIEGDQG